MHLDYRIFQGIQRKLLQLMDIAYGDRALNPRIAG